MRGRRGGGAAATGGGEGAGTGDEGTPVALPGAGGALAQPARPSAPQAPSAPARVSHSRRPGTAPPEGSLQGVVFLCLIGIPV